MSYVNRMIFLKAMTRRCNCVFNKIINTLSVAYLCFVLVFFCCCLFVCLFVCLFAVCCERSRKQFSRFKVRE